MKQLYAFIKKEFLHVFRDTKTLLLLFGLPVIMIVLFGFAMTNEIKNTKVLIVDHANDEASWQIIQKFKASDLFIIDEITENPHDIEASFKANKTKLAVIFPQNFNHDLKHGNAAEIQLIADASDPNTASTVQGYATQIIMDYQMGENIKLPMQIDMDIRMIYNPGLSSTVNFVPGVMALVLLLVSVLMTSASIVKEKELGTMEILLVSPFHPGMIIVAKTLPYLALSFVNLFIILLLSIFLLGMPMNGSLLLLLLASTLFIVAALLLGMFVSNVTDSQQIAMLVALMGMLVPTVLLTGFMFPIENMPYFLQLLSHIVPSKWFFAMVKNIMVKGLGWMSVWKEAVILLSMIAGLAILNMKIFKTRLE